MSDSNPRRRGWLSLGIAGVLATTLLVGAFCAVLTWLVLPEPKALTSERNFRELMRAPESLFREAPAVLFEPVSELLACVSCRQSPDCRVNHATELARTLVDPRSSFAMARGALLVLSLRLRYERTALASIHYALLSASHGAKGIGEICEKLFAKSCDELSAVEAWTLERGFFAHEGKSWRALNSERLKSDADTIQRECGGSPSK